MIIRPASERASGPAPLLPSLHPAVPSRSPWARTTTKTRRMTPSFGHPPPRAQGQYGEAPPVVSFDGRKAVWVLAGTVPCPYSVAGKAEKG
jgi:hypothetical protein